MNENGCCGRSDHTRALLTIEGTRWLAQRFAIDWVRLDDQRRPYVGDWRVNENWHIFGDPIVSVSGGRVLETLDALPENTPPTPATNLTPYTALGNHVIVAIGDGRFALYAHMQPGSVAVKAGDRVRRGQLLGRVGNTGSSAAPHLHFHVTDAPPAVASNGTPWVFDRFDYAARARNADAVNADVPAPVAVLQNAPPPRQRTREMPLKGDVVDFGGSRGAVLAGAGVR
jgi:murein DD-endopeptidase MepM/ murein hydrolase activator NlpD